MELNILNIGRTEGARVLLKSRSQINFSTPLPSERGI